LNLGEVHEEISNLSKSGYEEILYINSFSRWGTKFWKEKYFKNLNYIKKENENIGLSIKAGFYSEVSMA